MSAGTSKSSSRKKRVTDEDFDGRELREAIKKEYFYFPKEKNSVLKEFEQGDPSLTIKRRRFKIAWLKGLELEKLDYKQFTPVQKIREDASLKKIYSQTKRKRKKYYDSPRQELEKKILVQCNDGFLPSEGWGGVSFTPLISAFYFENTGRILRIYTYNVNDSSMGKWTAASVNYKELKTHKPYLNIFLTFYGSHFNFLTKKESVTDEEIKMFVDGGQDGMGARGFETYFDEKNIDPDGYCYFDSIAKSVRWTLKYEREDRDQNYPEGGGSPRMSSVPFQGVMVDLTDEIKSERKGSSKKRKRRTVMDFVDDKYKDGRSSDEEPELLVLPKDYSESDDDVEIISAEQNEKNIRAKLEAKRAKEREKEREKRAKAAERRMRDYRRSFSAVLKF